jgi:nickel-dependent lactate racemase
LNRSLYQAQKGIENTRSALKDGGTIILLADCIEGIGNTAFYNTIKSFTDIKLILEKITQKEYRFGDHKVYKFATLAMNSELILISNLTVEETKNVFATKMDINYLQEYLFELSPKSEIAVVLDAGTTVLKYLEKSKEI